MHYSTIITALLATTGGVFARHTGTIRGTGRPKIPGAYIVEFKSGHDTSKFFSDVKTHGHTRLDLDYKLFKGASVQIHDTENADELILKITKNNPAVLSVFPVEAVKLPEPTVNSVGNPQASSPVNQRRAGGNFDDSTYSPHLMTQVDQLRSFGYLGDGIKIAVIDTGIDYTHPDLGGCFGPGCLVSFGTDFVGDNYAFGTSPPVPDNDPLDCNGHGTHVAGIIAAQPNSLGFTGVAPGVTLGAYKVFGCTGSTGNDVLIAAYNQAFQDGAQIITASVGGASGWPEDPWAATVSRIVAQGVPCTLAAGNDGVDGQFYASGASDGIHATSIGSYDNTVTPVLQVQGDYTEDGGSTEHFGWTGTTADAWDGVSLPLTSLGTDPTVPNDACNALPGNVNLAGNVVLIRRGSCAFSVKLNNAAAAGAQYVLIYNNAPGVLSMSIAGADSRILGAASVTADQGVAWINDIANGVDVQLTFTGQGTAQHISSSSDNTATPGAASTFTSWGPTWELAIKPQFGAPGGNILSTYPVAKGSYAVLSGTSMATPHAAGVYALLAQALGTFNPQVIEDALATTAKPAMYNLGAGYSNTKAPVQQQGGGLIQAYDAAMSKSQLHPSYISYNDTAHHKKSATIKIVNNNSKAITYTLGNVNAPTYFTLASGAPYPEAFPNDAASAGATVSFSRSGNTVTKVVVGAHKSLAVTVSTTDPTGIDTSRLPIWSGWLTVNGTDGSALSIPYQGLAGSAYAAIVIASSDAYLAKLSDAQAASANLPNPFSDGTVFTLPAPGNDAPDGQDYPAVIAYLALGCRQVVAYVVPVNKPRQPINFNGYATIGQVNGFPVSYTTRGYLYQGWDGSLSDGNYVPAGTYNIVVAGLKLFGNPTHSSDWNTILTQSVTIKYA